MKIPALVSQLGLSIVIVGLAIALLNPWHFWMPTSFHMMLIGLLLAGVGLFALFIWRQKPVDEREELHLMIESRMAYLTGVLVLAICLIIQSFMHSVDPSVIIALGAMFIVKTIASIWLQIRR